MEKTYYNTKQKSFIFDILKRNNDKPLSPANILNILDSEKLKVSKSTLYRYLEKLYLEGIVSRFYNEGLQANEYQLIDKDHDCLGHLHLRCVNCGDTIHLDCDIASDFTNHILEDHGFTIDQKNTLIYGLCDKCKGDK